jgi:hypothetical protein
LRKGPNSHEFGYKQRQASHPNLELLKLELAAPRLRAPARIVAGNRRAVDEKVQILRTMTVKSRRTERVNDPGRATGADDRRSTRPGTTRRFQWSFFYQGVKK